MRLAILAAAERSASSSLDAAMLDGAALASALKKEGHQVQLTTLPAPTASWISRSVAAVETVGMLARLALQKPAPDAVLMVAPPMLPALGADVVAAARGIPGAVVLTALTGEARMRTGEFPRDSVEAMLLPALEAAVVRRARVLVVPTEALRRRVLLRGAQPDNVKVVRDMFSPLVPKPSAPHVHRLRQELAQGADCLVVLPAALGAATDLGALIGGLTRLRHDHAFAFAAVGGGSRARTLREMISARGIKNAQVVSLARQDRRAAVLAADVLLGIAVPAHDGLCVPRAVPRALWSGKPLVAVGPENSELVSEVRRLGIGPCVGPGDAEGLATVLRMLTTDVSSRRELASRAATAGAQAQSPLPGLLGALQIDDGMPASLMDTSPA
ncbi:MAG: glycosyltransferase [Myxococcota bacterium]